MSSTVARSNGQFGAVLTLKEWGILPTDKQGRVTLVLQSGEHVLPDAYHLEPHRLVAMARQILRQFDPSPEQEILAILQRIEDRLPEKE